MTKRTVLLCALLAIAAMIGFTQSEQRPLSDEQLKSMKVQYQLGECQVTAEQLSREVAKLNEENRKLKQVPDESK